jgi:hypothetical protein
MGNNVSYVFTCQILDCEVTKLLRRLKVAAAVIYAAMNQHLVSSVWAFMDPSWSTKLWIRGLLEAFPIRRQYRPTTFYFVHWFDSS